MSAYQAGTACYGTAPDTDETAPRKERTVSETSTAVTERAQTWFTRAAAARYAGKSPATIARWRNQGKLTGRWNEASQSWEYSRAALDAVFSPAPKTADEQITRTTYVTGPQNLQARGVPIISSRNAS